MPPSVSAFRAPKAGCAPEEWEDAFCFDPGQGRFCVADGASECSFSAAWARLLTEGFVARPPDGSTLRDWLRPLQEEWARMTRGRALPWYAEEKARSGAFSSILGICLEPEDCGWRALAIGDSCLFGVRENKLAASFPLSASSEFHTRPMLLSTAARANAGIDTAVRETEGRARPGDLLLLMTDALASWFLAEVELRRRPWAVLERIATQEEFDSFIDLMRVGRSMRNDDVTLLKIEVTP